MCEDLPEVPQQVPGSLPHDAMGQELFSSTADLVSVQEAPLTP